MTTWAQANNTRPVRRMDTRVRWVVLTLLACAIAVLLLLLPLYSGQTCTGAAGEPQVCTSTSGTLIGVNGPGVVMPLFVPAALCLLPALFPVRPVAWAVSGLLVGACLLSGFSVGAFYLPVAAGAVSLCVKDATARRT